MLRQPALDPAKVTGKIVLCERGTNARTDKSNAVKNAGGVGHDPVQRPTNSLNADFHFVPTIHVDAADGTAIKAYIAGTANPTASAVGRPRGQGRGAGDGRRSPPWPVAVERRRPAQARHHRRPA